MSRPPRAPRAAAFASAILLLAPLAAAQPTATATPPADVASSERLAARAFEAYQEKDYAGAISLYQEALAAAPSADIVYNIARIYDNGLRDRRLALYFYRRYVADPGAVSSRIETATRRLTELDAAERAAASSAPERAAPSSPSASGALAEAPVPAVAASRRQPSSGLTAGAITAGSIGLVGVGIGVGFGLAAKSDLEESKRYCDGNQCSEERGVAAAKSATRAANVATIGFSAGGGLLALGVILWLLNDGARAQPEESELARGLDWAPRVGPDELALTVSGTFAGL